MVISGGFAAQHSAIAAGSLAVSGVVKSFRKNTPLYGGVVVVVETNVFFGRPRKRTMVDDKITPVLDVEAGSRNEVGGARSDVRVVHGIVEYPNPRAEVTDD